MKKILILILLLLISTVYIKTLSRGNTTINTNSSQNLVVNDTKNNTLINVLNLTNGNISVEFCTYNNCLNDFEYLINHSRNIKCAFFDIDTDVLKNFCNKNATILIDYSNKKRAIPKCNMSLFYVINKKHLMHHKFCLINDSLLIEGSANPTVNGLTKNNNVFIITNIKLLIKNYKSLYNTLFENTNITSISIKNYIENYFCPFNCDYGFNRLLNILNKSNKSIYIAGFVMTNKQLANILINKAKQGLNISVIVETRMAHIKGSQVQRLIRNNISVFLDKNKNTMHHKFIIIDDKIIEFGSFNFSNNALYNNEDFIILFNKQIAEVFYHEFLRLIK